MMTNGPAEIDFGKRRVGSDIIAKFDLNNVSQTEIIVSITTTCGCLEPTIHYKGAVLDGNKIPAGESFSITVKYDSFRLGAFEKVISVDAIDTFGLLDSRILFTMKGSVE